MDTATEKLIATNEESGDVDLSESEIWSYQEEADSLLFKELRGNPVHPVNPKAERKEWSYNLHVSPATVHHAEAVFPTVRRICGRGPDDPVGDLDVNMAFWGIFLNTTLQAAVHLGQDCEANLRYVKNHLWNSGQLFNETGKLISE